MSMASTMCRQPSCPIAPPIRVPSVQNAMTLEPSIRPRTAQTPDVSVACRPTRVPSSSSAASRTSGSRGSIARGPACAGLPALVAAVLIVPAVDWPLLTSVGWATAVTIGTPDAPGGRYETGALPGTGSATNAGTPDTGASGAHTRRRRWRAVEYAAAAQRLDRASRHRARATRPSPATASQAPVNTRATL